MYKWLENQSGVSLVKRKLSSLDEVSLENFDIVINCSGVGAKNLVKDDAVKPISGHVLRVEAPDIHFTMSRGDEVYMIPK
jgi:hypothetical protein